MKKMRMIAMVLALCVLLSVPAMAAGGPVAENDKATVTVVEGAGASVAFNTANPEIIEVTVTSELLVPGDQYVILMVKSADGVNYDLDDPANILYINQTEQAGAAASGTNGSVSFNVYPFALTDSIILIAGVGGMTVRFGAFTITEVACALILGIVTNIYLGAGKEEEERERQEQKET